MDELANLLARERIQLQFLLFKILQLQHLLRTGDVRFLRWAAEEVRRAGQRLRATELARVPLVRRLADEADIAAGDLTLTTLAEDAPEPWRSIFEDHSQGFSRLAGEVDALVLLTRTLATASGHVVAEVLDELASMPPFGSPRAGVQRGAVTETMVLP